MSEQAAAARTHPTPTGHLVPVVLILQEGGPSIRIAVASPAPARLHHADRDWIATDDTVETTDGDARCYVPVLRDNYSNAGGGSPVMATTTVDLDWELVHAVRVQTGLHTDQEAVHAALQQFLAAPGKEERLGTDQSSSFWT